jgi:hypothetical protein
MMEISDVDYLAANERQRDRSEVLMIARKLLRQNPEKLPMPPYPLAGFRQNHDRETRSTAKSTRVPERDPDGAQP